MRAEKTSTLHQPNGGSAAFETTHWSLILIAAQEDQADSMAALESLCQSYWKPLYEFLRRSGYSPADAQDLTQGFFAHLIQKELLKKVKVQGGKFRTFLLVCLKNFVTSEWERSHAQKRGGGMPHHSIDDSPLDLEDSSVTPDAAFDKAWAVRVLQEAMDLLIAEYKTAGRQAVFDELRLFLNGDKCSLTYSVVAERLGTTEGAVKMMVRRMRRRYREFLDSVVLRTVSDPKQVQEELRHLVAALG